MRHDSRNYRELRKFQMERNPLENATASIILSSGKTKILWVGEIDSSPSASPGISVDFHRLPFLQQEDSKAADQTVAQFIKKALLTVLQVEKLATTSFSLHGEVLQDDGSLLAVGLNGAYQVLRLALDKLLASNQLTEDPLVEAIAGVSVGILASGMCVVDLDQAESQEAEVIFTIAMTESGKYAALQGLGRTAFEGDQLNEMIIIARTALETLIAYEKEDLLEMPMEEENTIVIATGNVGKAKEFAAMFEAAGYQIKTLKDYPELPEVAETGKTFEENARLKAETIAQILKQPVLADDSGLCVDALAGMPGIYSARFAGEQKSDAANNAKLLHELTEVSDEDRQAHFHCTLVFAAPGKDSLVVEADWPGKIGRIPRGDAGFGYDPLFIPENMTKTSAELTPAEKNTLSHRGQAMKKLQNLWQAWLEK